MEHGTIGVVGAGTIGRGVALALAQTGHRVALVDVARHVLDGAVALIEREFKAASLFDPALRASDLGAILGRISGSTRLEDLAASEFVIENATESWDVKRPLYAALGAALAGECVIAANTSAISIARLAEASGREDRVLGMHFMNPVPRKPVVEVIRAAKTSEATVAKARRLLARMGKEGILVNDKPGFVSNRVFMLTINEAVHVLQDGVAGARDVDAIFVRCFSHKMGPLATADLIGLDTVLRTLDVLRESYGLEKYAACPLLRSMVDRGDLGRKSGRGFYNYDLGRAS